MQINICDAAVLNPLRQQPSDSWAGGGGGGGPDRKALWAVSQSRSHSADVFLVGCDTLTTHFCFILFLAAQRRRSEMKSGVGLFLLVCSGVLHAGQWTDISIFVFRIEVSGVCEG